MNLFPTDDVMVVAEQIRSPGVYVEWLMVDWGIDGIKIGEAGLGGWPKMHINRRPARVRTHLLAYCPYPKPKSLEARLHRRFLGWELSNSLPPSPFATVITDEILNPDMVRQWFQDTGLGTLPPWKLVPYPPLILDAVSVVEALKSPVQVARLKADGTVNGIGSGMVRC